MNASSLIRTAVASLAYVVAAIATLAQVPAGVSKMTRFAQTSPTTLTTDPSFGDFQFRTTADAAALTPPSIVLPNGGGTRTLAFASGGWIFEQSFASQSNLDAAYPNGRYAVTIGGRTAAVQLSGDSYPEPAIATLSGGGYNGLGQLIVDRSAPLTITVPLSKNVSIIGTGGSNFDPSDATNASTTTTRSLTVRPNAFVVGGTYTIVLGGGTQTVATDSTSIPGFKVTASYGSITRIFIIIGTPPPGPRFTIQPISQTVAAGSAVTFTAAAIGANSFQWLKDGVNISGENGPSLEIRKAEPAQAGAYTVLAINSAAAVTSATATLTVDNPQPPNFAAHPVPQTVTVGSTVVFNATASRATSFQWRKDNADVTGATASTFVIQDVRTTQAGAYSVVASNSVGSVTSNAGTLSLSNSANFGHLINLSIRTNLTATDPSFTLGTVIGGAAGTKPLLVRAVGPSLAQFGINNAISAAKLDVFAGAAVVASNDGWDGSATMRDAFASVGAFALAGATSKDSAVFNPSSAARDYTVQVSANGGATGEVLAELYDAAPLAEFNVSSPRLVNVSVRKTINTGETLTVGFVIAGDTARTVLVRAIGPGLAAFGVPGTMPDPQLLLFSAAAKIAENDDWGGDAQLTSIGSGVGAFKIDDGRSRDAMLLLTLPPGSYTAQVRSAGAGGQALVEVYEVP